jgi:hypothetical protein
MDSNDELAAAREAVIASVAARPVTARPAAAPKKATAKPKAAAGTLGVRTAATIQSEVVADIRKKVAASGLTLSDKQIDMLVAIPTQIRAPLASLYQKDKAKYEKLASNYVKKIGGYLKKFGKKPPVEGAGGQKELLGIEASALTLQRKAAAAGAENGELKPRGVTAKARAAAAAANSSAETRATARTARSKGAAAVAPKPAAVHGPKLSAALGHEAPKFFIEKYLKALEAQGGQVKKVPHDKFAKYCGVFAERKTRKNKGTVRSRPAAAANTSASRTKSKKAAAPASNSNSSVSI